MQTTRNDRCSATEHAIRTRVDYAAGMIADTTGRKLSTTDDMPAKETPGCHTMSHWRYLEDEDGRQYRASALVLLDNEEEGRCTTTVEIGAGNRSSTARLTRDRAKDEAIVRHLLAIADLWEQGDADDTTE